jgi:hypothetical protein
MWTISDTGMLVNLRAVRSIGIEVSDDRQWVEVQVRWADGGERAAIVSLIVQEYGGVKPAWEIAQKYVDAIRAKIAEGGEMFELADLKPRDS